MTCSALLLANKIEIHLKLDETPGYYLTNEDQQIIIDCLRFTSINTNRGAAMTTEELIRTELEDLASNFESAGPEAPWTGQEIADHIRERIKNYD